MELTLQQLKRIIPGNPHTEHWFEALSQCLPDYEINTPQRIAAFFGQTKVESANYTAIHENLNYKPESLMRLWHKYFPTMEIANQYAHKPEKIANRAYANRMGNGPEESGDGWAHCGRGLIQLTGKSNYQAFADSLEITVPQAVEYLKTFEGCVQSACWFWESNNLNALADAGNYDALSKRVNGGTEGLEHRRAYTFEVLHILGA
jgi:putative chitinase